MGQQLHKRILTIALFGDWILLHRCQGNALAPRNGTDCDAHLVSTGYPVDARAEKERLDVISGERAAIKCLIIRRIPDLKKNGLGAKHLQHRA